ncbi:MAG TPA: FKBP-type peptidyl-prolyl cis-trans isomerase [Pseudomonadales bacterium]
MKHLFVTGLVAVAVLMAGCREETQEAPIDLTSLESRVSYAVGVSVGKNISGADFKVDQASFKAGLNDALSGAELRVSEADAQKAFEEFGKQQQAKAEAERAAEAEKSAQASKAFLEEYAKRDGVTKTDSGLMYKVVTAGEGKKPLLTDTVNVHYKGALVDGTEFDSSYARGQAVSFPVNAVIPGWVEALQLMPVGSKWEVVIPSDLAYGDEGAAPTIPPNAALVFEVELLGIGPEPVPEPKAAAQPKAASKAAAK